MSEFDRIDDIVRELGPSTSGQGVVLGPGDDAAILRIPEHHELIVSADTLVAGRHYPQGSDPELIAGRAMGVSLSDLSAMGATPRFVMISLTSETLTRDWAIGFGRGLARRAREYDVAIVGGNVAKGPQHVAVTVHGVVASGTAIKRSEARPGDEVWVTGTIGRASAALDAPNLDRLTFADLRPGTREMSYWQPPCRAPFGNALRGRASAAIDISDGLAPDLGHIADASAVNLSIDLEAIPIDADRTAEQAVIAGDDYELAFTAPASARPSIEDLARTHDVPVRVIGHVEIGRGVRWHRDGREIAIAGGYRHF